MGFFKDVIGSFTGSNDRRAADQYAAAEAEQRRQAKEQQYALLGQMKGPSVDPRNEARIKALEDESKLGLEVDPNFQGQLRQARVGGAQSLASIQNNQAATGAQGGFQNVGSMSDVYDRLGTQLAGLAQDQQGFREQKRDRAADARQAVADAEIEYQNSITQAKIAIEQGDAAAAQAAMAKAYQAKAAASNKLWQNIVGVGGLALGAATGSPQAAGAGIQSMQNANASSPSVGAGMSMGPSQSSQLQSQFNSMVNKPYYQQRSR